MSERRRRAREAAEAYTKQGDESETQPWQEYGDDIFAALEEAAKPQQGNGGEQTLPIHRIFADTTQPRRAVPLAVAAPLKWEGTTEGLADVLEEWHTMACNAARYRFEVADFLQEKETIDLADKPAIFTAWVDLLKLAASIRKQGIDVGDPVKGLNNPILVREVGQLHAIVAGERRWLAFNILTYWLESDDWRRIPVRITTASEWAIARAQAEENTQRRQLNAIGLARQFAKLLMTSRNGMEGITYTPMEQIVLPGECDRRYYAQVANGNIHRIPRGMGAEFETAMNITTGQMRQYRALLRLTDDEAINDVLWTLADDRDWAERFLRDVSAIPLETLRKVLPTDPYRYHGNGIDIESALREAISAASVPPPSPPAAQEESVPPAPPSNPPSNSPHSVGGGRPSWMDEPPTQPFVASTPSNPPSGSTRFAGGGQDYDARRDENFPWKVADRVLSPNGHLCRVDEIKRDGSIVLQRLDNLRYITYAPGVTLRPAEEAPVPGMTGHAPTGLFSVGQWVRDRAGNRYRVLKLGDGDGTVYVERERGGRGWYPAESLSADRPGEGLTGHAPTDDGREYASEGETGTGGNNVFSANPAIDEITREVVGALVIAGGVLGVPNQTLDVLDEMYGVTPEVVWQSAEQTGMSGAQILEPYLLAAIEVLHAMQAQIEDHLNHILEGVDDLSEGS